MGGLCFCIICKNPHIANCAFVELGVACLALELGTQQKREKPIQHHVRIFAVGDANGSQVFSRDNAKHSIVERDRDAEVLVQSTHEPVDGDSRLVRESGRTT